MKKTFSFNGILTQTLDLILGIESDTNSNHYSTLLRANNFYVMLLRFLRKRFSIADQNDIAYCQCNLNLVRRAS